MAQNTLLSSKTHLRKLMKDTIKSLSVEEKARQTKIVTDHLLHENKRFSKAKHIGLFLSMKHEELDTHQLIENILTEHRNKHVYVPYVEMNSKIASDTRSEMVFFELESLDMYNKDMNENNKFRLRQFNNITNMVPVSESLFDLILVPGLAFDVYDNKVNEKCVSRLGRGKGFYDVFLRKIPNCYTIGIGFNEQYIPFNETFLSNKINVPIDIQRDVLLNEYLCEKSICNY
jgi:5-formyltetrahydrofolate cyclo-ligase